MLNTMSCYMQELTEEGLPFVILFHHPDDAETTEKFRKLVTKELIAEKSKCNPGDFYDCDILPAIQAKSAKMSFMNMIAILKEHWFCRIMLNLFSVCVF